MPRALSSEKREQILEAAKRLFARQGFAPTSISDIVRETGHPVGTIYTYFPNKEEIIRAIVEEGWQSFRNRLSASLAAENDHEAQVRVLVDEFLPELLEDIDFINILLSEGLPYTHLEEKIRELGKLVTAVLLPLAKTTRALSGFGPKQAESALIVYFLGILDAVRLSKSTQIQLSSTDILEFLRLTIRNALGVRI